MAAARARGHVTCPSGFCSLMSICTGWVCSSVQNPTAPCIWHSGGAKRLRPMSSRRDCCLTTKADHQPTSLCPSQRQPSASCIKFPVCSSEAKFLLASGLRFTNICEELRGSSCIERYCSLRRMMLTPVLRCSVFWTLMPWSGDLNGAQVCKEDDRGCVDHPRGSPAVTRRFRRLVDPPC